jgi:outer membrane lipoprotein LolB
MKSGVHFPFFRSVVLLASCFLAACASFDDKAIGLQDNVVGPCGPGIEHFELRGRAMIRQAQRIDHLRFDWTHDLRTDRLLLTTPFGQGVAQITREHPTSRVLFADGKQIERENLVELSKAIFGTSLPLDELSDWLRGAHDQRHALSNGWNVLIEQIDALTIDGQRRCLPRIITATQADISMRVIVDQRGEAND